MAKRFIKISLATKFRILYGAAVLGIIAAALLVPWLFMEKVVEQGIERRGAELLRLQYNEFLLSPNHRGDDVAKLYHANDREGREGPSIINLVSDSTTQGALDLPARQARDSFKHDRKQDVAVIESENHAGSTVYRCFKALRVNNDCLKCHGASAAPKLQFQDRQFVGMIDLTMPASAVNEPLVWWTRGMFVAGGVLATLLAVVLFAVITQRLVLRPVRKLRNMADKVTEGDLTVRSTVKTGDELQRLGESFNEMLSAIADQHEKLRSANRALDLKLSELAEANVTLFQANKVKNEFLANVSHELRTPLNSILGFADLVVEGADEKLARYASNISSAAKNLLAMINDLLDLAKIEAGKTQVRLDKVSVTDTCQTLAALMRPMADKKQLKLDTQLDSNLPLIVTDGGKLQQILYNLLSNAIKFTPVGGQVTLSAGLASQSVSPSLPQESPAGEAATAPRTGPYEVFVSVADTGPGIAEADQQLVFEKFYQGDKTLTKESSGTGLGLAISKELTNLLGGRLTLKSSPGQGSTFTLTLPVEGGQKGITCTT